LANSNVAFLDLTANQSVLGENVSAQIKPVFAALGLQLTQFAVENVSLPEELAKVLDQRIGMSMVGDVSRYTQYAAAESLDLAAANTSGGAGVGMGLGAGAAVAQVLASSLRSSAPAAASAFLPPAGATDSKFCIDCGKPIAARAKFCAECGQPQ
jgi:membrane protease subunit (stomatin/prohibitin family)